MGTHPDIAEVFKTLSGSAVMVIGGIIAGAVLLILVSERALPWLANRLHGKHRIRLLAAVPLVRLLISGCAVVLVIPRLVEPTVQNMVAILGAVGLAVGFAVKDYVSSIIAGIVAVNEMTYRTGDWVTVGDDYGEITHIGMRALEILTPDDTVVVIPHQQLWNEPIHNANDGGPNLMCVINFYLDPDHDAAAIRDLLHDVALTSPFLQAGQPIRVTVRETYRGTHYRLKAYPIDPRQQFRFGTDLTVRGKAALIRRGVAMVTPQAWGGESES